MDNDNLTFFHDEGLCDCGMTYDEEDVYKELKWWLEGCIQIIVNIFGLVGNLVSIPVLLSKDHKSLFYMTLTILTFFDSIFNITDVLESIRKIHYDRTSCTEMTFAHGLHLHLWPQFLYPLRSVAMTCSIYMTVALSIERYIAVSRPFVSYTASYKKTWKSMLRYTSAMVVAIASCTAPLFAEFTVGNLYYECTKDGFLKSELNYTTYQQRSVQNADQKSTTANSMEVAVLVIQWTDLRVNPSYIACYKTVFMALMTGIIPLAVLTITNYLIHKHIRKRRQEWSFSRFNLHHGNYKREEMQTRLLFGIVIVFLIGHSFRIIMDIQELIDMTRDVNNPYLSKECNHGCASPFSLWSKVALLLQTLLMATSHSINLIIYCLSNPAFRKRVYRKYCRQTTSLKSTESNTSGLGYRMSQLRIRRIRSTISKDTPIEGTSSLIPSELRRSLNDNPRAGHRSTQSKSFVNLSSANDSSNATFKTTQEKLINRKRVSI